MEEEQDTMVELPLIGHLTYRESHAFVDGLYCGVTNIKDTSYSKEKHYWRVGWLLGDLYDNKFR
jgi:hypothetical protein